MYKDDGTKWLDDGGTKYGKIKFIYSSHEWWGHVTSLRAWSKLLQTNFWKPFHHERKSACLLT